MASPSLYRLISSLVSSGWSDADIYACCAYVPAYHLVPMIARVHFDVEMHAIFTALRAELDTLYGNTIGKVVAR